MQYVAILRHYSVFAEYSDYNDNFQDLIVKFYIANKQNIEFYVIPYLSQYEIFFLHYNDYVLTAICNPNMDHEEILIYLQHLKQEFSLLLAKEKEELTLNATKLIKQSIENFFQQQRIDKFKLVENELEEVTKEKHSLLKNMIDKELKLDVEIEKSNKLLSSVSILLILTNNTKSIILFILHYLISLCKLNIFLKRYIIREETVEEDLLLFLY